MSRISFPELQMTRGVKFEISKLSGLNMSWWCDMKWYDMLFAF